MKYKVGDTVYIRSGAWMDAQVKTDEGFIDPGGPGNYYMDGAMQACAGKAAVVTSVVEDEYYELDITGEKYAWEDWMLDEPADAAEKEAI